MTDRRGRSDRKSIVSDPTLATEEAAVVGARVQAHFAGRAERGEQFPERQPVAAAPGDAATVEAKLQRLRVEFEAALAEIGSRLFAVGVRADAASARAERAVAAGETLAKELRRIASSFPPEVATELDEAIERFDSSLQSA